MIEDLKNLPADKLFEFLQLSHKKSQEQDAEIRWLKNRLDRALNTIALMKEKIKQLNLITEF